MSLYKIALAVFLITVGLLYLFTLGRTAEVIAGVAGLAAGLLLVFDEVDNRPRV